MKYMIFLGLIGLCVVRGRDLYDLYRDDISHSHTSSGSDSGSSWTLDDGPNGLYNWAKNFPHCGGENQSPIALGRPHRVVYVPKGKNNYNIPKEMGVVSSDSYLELFIYEDIHMPMQDEIFFNTTNQFSLFSIHFKWGYENWYGSDHSIDGVHFPIEVRFGFTNKKYKTIAESGQYPDGRIENSHFIKVDKYAKPNPVFDELLNLFSKVNGSSQTVPYQYIDKLPEWDWFRENDYYSYQGSLVFPPCSSAPYNVFITDFVINQAQMDALRSMRRPDGSDYGITWRTIQPQNQRKVTYVTRDPKKSPKRKAQHEKRWDRRSGGSLRPGDYDSFSSWDDHFGDDWRHGGHDEFSSWDDFDAPSSLEGDRFRHHGMYEDDFYGPRRSAGRGRFPDLPGVRHRPGHGYA